MVWHYDMNYGPKQHMMISYESIIIHELFLHICHTISYKNLSRVFPHMLGPCYIFHILPPLVPRYPSWSPSDAELGELRIKPGADVFRGWRWKTSTSLMKETNPVFSCLNRKKKQSKNIISIHVYIYPIYIYKYTYENKTHTRIRIRVSQVLKQSFRLHWINIYAGSYAQRPACSPWTFP